VTTLAPNPVVTSRVVDASAKEAWSYADLGLLFEISRNELVRMVARGQLPKPHRVGKLARFSPSEVRAAFAALPRGER
jgi:hypothetical protein